MNDFIFLHSLLWRRVVLSFSENYFFDNVVTKTNIEPEIVLIISLTDPSSSVD